MALTTARKRGHNLLDALRAVAGRHFLAFARLLVDRPVLLLIQRP